MRKIVVLAALLALPALASAMSADGGGSFNDVAAPLYAFVTGPVGIAISLIAVVVGFGISVSRSNPSAVMMGIAAAGFIHFAPGIVLNFMGVALEDAPPAQTVSLARSVASPLPTTPVQEVAGAASQPAAKSPVVVTSPTVPVPAASRPAPALDSTYNTSGSSGSDLMKWLGVAGGSVIASLLILFVVVSRRRKTGEQSGLSRTSGTPAGMSVFQDPHGFTRSAPKENP